MEESEQLIGEDIYEYRGGEIFLSKYSDRDGIFYEVATDIDNLGRYIGGIYSTEDEALKVGKANIDTYYSNLLRAVKGE
jgi:hypothetical protein